MMAFESTEVLFPKDCPQWPLGQCKFGADCFDNHHEMLNPEAVKNRPHDFMVPNDTGVACLRCLQTFRECDKLGRDDENDPCSECRWFGGANCDCQLALHTSYNDQVWRCMMQRSDQDFQLPASRPRDEARRAKRPPPQPMSQDRVKADWVGESHEELLVKTDDFLPDYVRAHPRAYVVPPRPAKTATAAKELTRESIEHIAVRKLDESDSDQYESSNEAPSPRPTAICRYCLERGTPRT